MYRPWLGCGCHFFFFEGERRLLLLPLAKQSTAEHPAHRFVGAVLFHFIPTSLKSKQAAIATYF
jgi:hypothetical protein